VTPQLDSFRRWCEAESIGLATEQDDDQALVCTISISGEPPLTLRLESPRRTPGPTLLSYTFEPAVPAEVAVGDQGRERVAALLERVAAGRSALVSCRLDDSADSGVVEVVVTLHEDGLTKQTFLTAVAEFEKVRNIVSWELESMGLAASMMSEVQTRVGGIVQEAEELASEAASAAAPAAAQDGPPDAAGRFCNACGKQAKPEQRFCNGCGAPFGG
jgi:hypothetical protein